MNRIPIFIIFYIRYNILLVSYIHVNVEWKQYFLIIKMKIYLSLLVSILVIIYSISIHQLRYEHGQGQELIFNHYNSFEYGKHFIFYVTKDIYFNSKQKQKLGYFVIIVAKYTTIIHEEYNV